MTSWKTVAYGTGIGLVALIALMLVALNASRSAQRDAVAADAQAANDLNEVRALIAEAKQSPAQRQIAAAARVWSQFDRLRGPTFHTKEMLVAHLMQANQTTSGLPDDEAAAVTTYNEIEFRKRYPTVIVAGEEGAATGDKNTIIIPPGGTARCEKFAKSWRQGDMRETLRSAGYKAIRCGDAQNVAEDWSLGPN